MNRKEFLRTSGILTVSGMAALAAFIESCDKDDDNAPQAPTVNFNLDLTASSNAALSNVGGYVYNSGVIVACIAAGSYVALSQACTHQGCTVAYSSSGSSFNCPCHGGRYNTSGNVIAGPPPSPLKKYTVTQNGNILNVAG
jgi:cytochrome b6-f complex iron-sulfur subunit